MRKLYLLLFFAVSFLISCNSNPKAKPKEKTVIAAYSLPLPQGWSKEVFPIPINFAPAINYNGHEEIRFAPGWGDSTKAGYWSYAFLWCLDDNPNISDSIVESNLRYYYDGLIRSNSQQFHLTNAMMFPTETSFTKVAAENDDLQTYTGTVKMLDYMRQQPQVLNSIVHLKFCSAVNKYMVFHKISPRPVTDSVWTDLNRLWIDFKCGTQW
jgi:hypothetical protein